MRTVLWKRAARWLEARPAHTNRSDAGGISLWENICLWYVQFIRANKSQRCQWNQNMKGLHCFVLMTATIPFGAQTLLTWLVWLMLLGNISNLCENRACEVINLFCCGIKIDCALQIRCHWQVDAICAADFLFPWTWEQQERKAGVVWTLKAVISFRLYHAFDLHESVGLKSLHPASIWHCYALQNIQLFFAAFKIFTCIPLIRGVARPLATRAVSVRSFVDCSYRITV